MANLIETMKDGAEYEILKIERFNAGGRLTARVVF